MNIWSNLDLSDSLVLVSCVKSKLTRPAPAKDLYVSAWFQKARALVEKHKASWFILSALHGLVPPDKVIEPYELTLKTMKAADRRAWAERVWRDLKPLLKEKHRVTFLAGMSYREFLAGKLNSNGTPFDVPMEGLPQGMQLSWLGARLAE